MKESLLKLIRSLTRNEWLEKLIITQTAGKRRNSFWAKLLPRRDQYSSTDYRDAVREGIKYRLYLNDYEDYWIYLKVKAEHREYYDLVKDGMVVMDIGTNIGMSLLNFTKRNPSGYNYGFEPVPETYNKAAHNVSVNPFKNVEVNQLALSDEEGMLYFDYTEEHKSGKAHSGGNFLLKGGKKDSISVRATTLEKFVAEKNITKIDFIKMDVEGFEINVIKGGMEILKRLKPMFYIEVNDSTLKRQGQTPEQLLALLKEIGYKIESFPDKKLLENMNDFTNCYFDVLCIAQ